MANRTDSRLLVESRIHQGVWDALVGPFPTDAPPSATVRCGGRTLAGLTLSAEPDRPGYWRATLPLPADLISDRVQTVVLEIGDGAEARDAGRICVAAGQALVADLTAEVAALRAELDLLKSVTRKIAMSQQVAADIARPSLPSRLPVQDVALLVTGPEVVEPGATGRTTDTATAAAPAAPSRSRRRLKRPAPEGADGAADAADLPPPGDPAGPARR